jgi:hypothetical protein
VSKTESFGVTPSMSFTEPAPRHAKADPADLRVSHGDGWCTHRKLMDDLFEPGKEVSSS